MNWTGGSIMFPFSCTWAILGVPDLRIDLHLQLCWSLYGAWSPSYLCLLPGPGQLILPWDNGMAYRYDLWCIKESSRDWICAMCFKKIWGCLRLTYERRTTIGLEVEIATKLGLWCGDLSTPHRSHGIELDASMLIQCTGRYYFLVL